MTALEKFHVAKKQILKQKPQFFVTNHFNKDQNCLDDDQIIKEVNTSLEKFITDEIFDLNNKYDSGYQLRDKFRIEAFSEGYRSIGDLYALTRYYFPECTLEDFIIILYGGIFNKTISANTLTNVQVDDIDRRFTKYVGHYCLDIHKRVFTKRTDAFEELNWGVYRFDWVNRPIEPVADEYNMTEEDWREVLGELQKNKV